MACHYPKPAYLSRDGKITFTKRDALPSASGFTYIRCGMCRGCKFDHARDWAVRCYHEAQLHERACAITLTYDEEHLPPHGSLSKRDLQLFFMRLRNAVAPVKIRYFACGEYGTRKGRPHYHVILFGYCPSDRSRVWTKSEAGNIQYLDLEVFEKAWPHGVAPWADFHHHAARYVAHYTADKLKSYAKDKIDPETGLRPYEVMDRDGQIWQLTPEFQLQSLKPAIGLKWLEKNWREVFPADSCVMDGREYPPPRYYYKWLKEHHPDVWQIVQAKRKAAILDAEYETGLRQHQIASARDARIARYARTTHQKQEN